MALTKRRCELSYFAEADDGDRKIAVIFDNVEAYRCTYMTACNVGMARMAYDQIVRLDDTDWLEEVRRSVEQFHSKRRSTPPPLQHLMVYFDDGPCYEIICTGFAPVAE
ncbi:hypothetical protein ACQR1W_35505 [Bradyrhizobium sp. HKCCYLS1011]|uniref:hypothetical protein n=1 Tax=Bradyrhizobium sp. HKCCYLS1011 TaxID=3420733 RepID=UPI003EB72338